MRLNSSLGLFVTNFMQKLRDDLDSRLPYKWKEGWIDGSMEQKGSYDPGSWGTSVWPAVISPKLLSLSFVRFTLNEFEVRNRKCK